MRGKKSEEEEADGIKVPKRWLKNGEVSTTVETKEKKSKRKKKSRVRQKKGKASKVETVIVKEKKENGGGWGHKIFRFFAGVVFIFNLALAFASFRDTGTQMLTLFFVLNSYFVAAGMRK